MRLLPSSHKEMRDHLPSEVGVMSRHLRLRTSESKDPSNSLNECGSGSEIQWRTRGESDADSTLPGRCPRSLRRGWFLALRELAGSRQPTARGNRQAPRTRRAGARPWLAGLAPCTCWLWLHTFRLSPEDQSPRSNSTQRHTALRMTLAHAPFEKMTARRQICSSAASAAATTETARSKSRKASPGCRR